MEQFYWALWFLAAGTDLVVYTCLSNDHMFIYLLLSDVA